MSYIQMFHPLQLADAVDNVNTLECILNDSGHWMFQYITNIYHLHSLEEDTETIHFSPLFLVK